MELVLVGIALIALGLLARSQHLQARVITRLLDLIGENDKRAQEERHDLVNRLQFPERPPTRPTGGKVTSNISPESRRALRQVGTIAPQVRDGSD